MTVKNGFRYPVWVKSVCEISRISRSEDNPLIVSLIETDRHKQILDIRIFHDGIPSRSGVFVTYESALKLVDIVKSFLVGEYAN